jgi:hypothetical protein
MTHGKLLEDENVPRDSDDDVRVRENEELVVEALSR